MINARDDARSHPSASPSLNRPGEALKELQSCGPEGLLCTSCHGQTLMKVIEDVIRGMCLLSEVASGVITHSHTSLISIFHGFALPLIACLTLCHRRKCQRSRTCAQICAWILQGLAAPRNSPFPLRLQLGHQRHRKTPPGQSWACKRSLGVCADKQVIAPSVKPPHKHTNKQGSIS